jgi:hypothetical protein
MKAPHSIHHRTPKKITAEALRDNPLLRALVRGRAKGIRDLKKAGEWPNITRDSPPSVADAGSGDGTPLPLFPGTR